jgi:hypothetical protein
MPERASTCMMSSSFRVLQVRSSLLHRTSEPTVVDGWHPDAGRSCDGQCLLHEQQCPRCTLPPSDCARWGSRYSNWPMSLPDSAWPAFYRSTSWKRYDTNPQLKGMLSIHHVFYVLCQKSPYEQDCRCAVKDLACRKHTARIQGVQGSY